MITVESSIGALIELRFIGNQTEDDVRRFVDSISAVVKRTVKHEQRRVVLCTDLRWCGLLPPEASDIVLSFMRADTPHVIRNGFLGNKTAVLSLQVHRMIGEAGDPSLRRLFMMETPLISWLGEMTTPAEQARLRIFLAEGRRLAG